MLPSYGRKTIGKASVFGLLWSPTSLGIWHTYFFLSRMYLQAIVSIGDANINIVSFHLSFHFTVSTEKLMKAVMLHGDINSHVKLKEA